jgi:hypothetical protein
MHVVGDILKGTSLKRGHKKYWKGGGDLSRTSCIIKKVILTISRLILKLKCISSNLLHVFDP